MSSSPALIVFSLPRTLRGLRQRAPATPDNSNGFIPGEAGCAVLVGAPDPGSRGLVCLGIGSAMRTPRSKPNNPSAPTDWCRRTARPSAKPAEHAAMSTTASPTPTANSTGSRKRRSAQAASGARGASSGFWHPRRRVGATGAALIRRCLSAGLGRPARPIPRTPGA